MVAKSIKLTQQKSPGSGNTSVYR